MKRKTKNKRRALQNQKTHSDKGKRKPVFPICGVTPWDIWVCLKRGTSNKCGVPFGFPLKPLQKGQWVKHLYPPTPQMSFKHGPNQKGRTLFHDHMWGRYDFLLKQPPVRCHGSPSTCGEKPTSPPPPWTPPEHRLHQIGGGFGAFGRVGGVGRVFLRVGGWGVEGGLGLNPFGSTLFGPSFHPPCEVGCGSNGAQNR